MLFRSRIADRVQPASVTALAHPARQTPLKALAYLPLPSSCHPGRWMNRLGRVLALAVIAALPAAFLGGCAGVSPTSEAMMAAGLPARVDLKDTPFFAQEQHQCGPASLAMALGAASYPSSPKELAQMVFLPDREGSLQAEMLVAARRRGAKPPPAGCPAPGSGRRPAASRHRPVCPAGQRPRQRWPGGDIRMTGESSWSLSSAVACLAGSGLGGMQSHPAHATTI